MSRKDCLIHGLQRWVFVKEHRDHSKGSWLLATYLIPGCVGREVRLRSESSSGTAASGSLEIWEPGNLEIWEPGNMKIWKYGHRGTWKYGNLGSQTIQKNEILKINICSGQNIRNVWGSRKKTPEPFSGHFGGKQIRNSGRKFQPAGRPPQGPKVFFWPTQVAPDCSCYKIEKS